MEFQYGTSSLQSFTSIYAGGRVRSGNMEIIIALLLSNFHIKAHPRAHSALASNLYSRNGNIFGISALLRLEDGLLCQDGLLFAKSLLSHSAVHLVVLSVLRSIGFQSSVQTSKLTFHLFPALFRSIL